MHRSLVKSGELQLRVERGLCAGISSKRICIGPFKLLANGGAGVSSAHLNEAPWLAQAHRRSKTREGNQILQQALRQWRRDKLSDVPAAEKQLPKLLAKLFG